MLRGKWGFLRIISARNEATIILSTFSGLWAHYFQNFDLVFGYSHPVNGVQRTPTTVTDTRFVDGASCRRRPDVTQTRTRKVNARTPAMISPKSYVRLYPDRTNRSVARFRLWIVLPVRIVIRPAPGLVGFLAPTCNFLTGLCFERSKGRWIPANATALPLGWILSGLRPKQINPTATLVRKEKTPLSRWQTRPAPQAQLLPSP